MQGLESDRILSYETHLDLSHWNNLDAQSRNWSEYNEDSDQMRQREELTSHIIQLIKTEILPKLTPRQREITLLYFECHCKEEEIARKLGISQPTVSQHLFGKRRGEKIVGGSVRKIRKLIKFHTKADTFSAESLSELNLLFDEK